MMKKVANATGRLNMAIDKMERDIDLLQMQQSTNDCDATMAWLIRALREGIEEASAASYDIEQAILGKKVRP